MTYVELMNRFWALFQIKIFSSNDALLYFYLLKVWDSKRGLNPFELRSRNTEDVLRIARKTIIESRNRLKQRGLIDFYEGTGKKSPTYTIVGAELKTLEQIEKEVVTVGNHIGNNSTKQEPRDVTVGNHIGNHTGNNSVTKRVTTQKKSAGTPILNNKYNITNIECSSNTQSPRGDCSRVSVQPSLFADVEKKKSKQKPKTPKEAPPPTPTLEEVRAYFQRKASDKIQNWEESAQRFYDYFAAVDWRDKYNRRITRWDSRANSWILDEQQRQKENLIKHHVEPTTNRPNPTADERQQRQSELIDFVARNIGSNKGAPGCDGDDLPI
jgi:hypothetical protein